MPVRPAHKARARCLTAKVLAGALAGWTALAPQVAQAAGLIRDAETEELIREYARPIFQAAGLGAQNIQIHLVGDLSFNAFVVDGQNMFMNVGTIIRSETPNQVIGVIAHESGHIAGGHLSRLRELLSQAKSTALMAQILGAAAIAAGAIAGGGGQAGAAGAAIALGGQSVAGRSILAYRRVEESQADQAAVTYLNATHQSAAGMLKTFEYFVNQGLTSLRYVDPYLQSHPMPQQRIVQLRELAISSPYFNRKDSPGLQGRHNMVRAKLIGFLENPRTVFRKFPQTDQSLPARYARAIALKRQSGLKPFLPEIDRLIAIQPNNPYFYEIKGQFLFEDGQAAAAVPVLQRSVEMAPKAGLIRIMLAQALLATNSPAHVDQAIVQLRNALVQEDKSALGYRQLANAYARKGRISDAELASAQAYLYEGNIPLAKRQAERAKAKLKPGTSAWLKADDIVSFQPPPR